MAIWIAVVIVILAIILGSTVSWSIRDRKMVEAGLREERRRLPLHRRAERNAARFRRGHEAHARKARGGRAA